MVSVITCTNRDYSMTNVFQNFLHQTVDNKDKELIIILNNDEMDMKKWKREADKYKNISVYRISEKVTLGQCLNFGIDKARFDVIAKLDDDDYYSPNYLSSMIDSMNEQNASIVGKTSMFVYYKSLNLLSVHLPNQENRFCKHVAGATLVFKKSVVKKVKFRDINQGSDQKFLADCVSNGFIIYSNSKYNFVCIRNSNKSHHTWKVEDRHLLKYGKKVAVTKDFKPYVIR